MVSGESFGVCTVICVCKEGGFARLLLCAAFSEKKTNKKMEIITERRGRTHGHRLLARTRVGGGGDVCCA